MNFLGMIFQSLIALEAEARKTIIADNVKLLF